MGVGKWVGWGMCVKAVVENPKCASLRAHTAGTIQQHVFLVSAEYAQRINMLYSLSFLLAQSGRNCSST